MAHKNVPARLLAPLAAPTSGAAAPFASGHLLHPLRGARDWRQLDTSGVIRDCVMSRAGPAAPETPFANARVWLLRLADGYKAWEGFSDAQGRYVAQGLEAGVDYIVVGIDPVRRYKAIGAGPVKAAKGQP